MESGLELVTGIIISWTRVVMLLLLLLLLSREDIIFPGTARDEGSKAGLVTITNVLPRRAPSCFRLLLGVGGPRRQEIRLPDLRVSYRCRPFFSALLTRQKLVVGEIS